MTIATKARVGNAANAKSISAQTVQKNTLRKDVGMMIECQTQNAKNVVAGSVILRTIATLAAGYCRNF